MAKLRFWGHMKQFQSKCVRHVMPISVTLIGSNPHSASHKTAGDEFKMKTDEPWRNTFMQQH